MEVVVTGANGFVGQHVTPMLAALPRSLVRRIVAVDRIEPKHDFPRVVNVVLDLAGGPVEELNRVFSSADVVVHLAALVDTRGAPSIARAVHEVNCGATGRIAMACGQQLRRFVFVSSVAALQPELSAYGQSKADAERALAALLPPEKLVVLRPHVVFGAGDPLGTQLIAWTPRWLPVVMIAPSDNKIVATDVGELADAIVAFAVQVDRALPSVVAANNIGGDDEKVFGIIVGRPLTYSALVEIILGRPTRLITIPYWVVMALACIMEWLDFALRYSLASPILRIMNRQGVRHANVEEPMSYARAAADQQRIASWISSSRSPLPPQDSSRAPTKAANPLSTPRRLGPVLLRGPVIKAATYESMNTAQLARFHARMARGGVGLSIVSYGAVSDNGKTFDKQPSFESSESVVAATFAPVVDAVHAVGGAIGIQLTHAGAFADTPRPISAKSWVFNPLTYRFSSAMTADDERHVERSFLRAVLLSCNLGFDAVEIHCGHGYLLSQCLAGGCEELVFRIVEQACTIAHERGVAVLVKFNVDGSCRRSVARWMRRFCDAGADALVPSGGHVMEDGLAMLRGGRPLLAMARAQPDVAKKLGVLLFGPVLIPKRPYSEAFFRRESLSAAYVADVPLSKVALVGGVQDRGTAVEALEDGFGFVCMGRALLRDPDMILKEQSRPGTISSTNRMCDRCNRCIVGPTMRHEPLVCVTSVEEGIHDW